MEREQEEHCNIKLVHSNPFHNLLKNFIRKLNHSSRCYHVIEISRMKSGGKQKLRKILNCINVNNIHDLQSGNKQLNCKPVMASYV